MQRTGSENQQSEKASVVRDSIAKASLESTEFSFPQILCRYKSALKYQRLFLRLHFLSRVTTWGQHHTHNGTFRAPVSGISHLMKYCAHFEESHLPEKSWQTRSRSKNSNKDDYQAEDTTQKNITKAKSSCLRLVWLGAESWPPSIWRVTRNYFHIIKKERTMRNWWKWSKENVCDFSVVFFLHVR